MSILDRFWSTNLRSVRINSTFLLQQQNSSSFLVFLSFMLSGVLELIVRIWFCLQSDWPGPEPCSRTGSHHTVCRFSSASLPSGNTCSRRRFSFPITVTLRVKSYFKQTYVQLRGAAASPVMAWLQRSFFNFGPQGVHQSGSPADLVVTSRQSRVNISLMSPTLAAPAEQQVQTDIYVNIRKQQISNERFSNGQSKGHDLLWTHGDAAPALSPNAPSWCD